MAQPSKKTDQVDINNERSVRVSKLQKLEEMGIPGFPARVPHRQNIQTVLLFAHDEQASVAGRVMIKREIGKVTFCTLKDETGTIQIVFKKEDDAIEMYDRFVKNIDAGDIVAVTGIRFVTKTGEESILVTHWTLLTKSLLPLPDKFHGLQDEETRFRKRYLDYLVNEDQKEKITTRSSIIWAMREFLHKEGFIEIETPMLETIASGAMAQTFDTHLNVYNLPVHLRIAVGELWQKRLLVGGFEKIFELGRAFRNEGVSFQHNPEFTMIEYYWAYADFEDNMALHERMIPYLVQGATGSLQITHDNVDIDFTPPYARVSFHDVVLEHTGIDIDEYADVASLGAAMKDKGFDTEGITERGKLMDALYKQGARPNIIQPTFVLNYPVELKPLAKRADDPRYTEMFQLLVHGFELSNSYTELNDPLDQRARFEEQARNKAEGDDEAMANDWDYVEALEHGMPPATGTGIGIDRLTMLLTDTHSIREVITFPIMKPVDAPAPKKKGTSVAHVVLYRGEGEPVWSFYNAVAHLTAAFGARTGKSLFRFTHSNSKDGTRFPMNTQHAILIKETQDRSELHRLFDQAQAAGLHVEVFTKDMQASTNDAKVDAFHKEKNFADIEIIGVLLFGERDAVDACTKPFTLLA